ncbi:MAG: ROK family protein [Clostridia bacterium]|nr:ROK family protein [Clostridia bacterium]
MFRVGIDLGGTKVAFGLVSDDGTLVKKVSIVTDRNATAEELTAQMAQYALEFIGSCGIDRKDVRSIGIGCPGACDNESGILILTVNLPFRYTNIRKIFSKYTDIPVYLGNDANCAALGEALFGGGKGASTCLAITLGTGVGGGIIIDGKIYTGFNGVAGELGHMVVRKGGVKCGCGRKGCFETYASATAVIRETKKAAIKHPESLINELCGGDLEKINAKTAFDAMRAGDKTGTALVKTYIKDLGEGIINYINIFQPEVILIGGGISKEGEGLLKPLRRYVFRFSYGAKMLPRPRIEKAVLGNDAGIIGAAMLS